MRLLSFLDDVERALLADTAAGHGKWHNERAVNFTTGIARLTLTPPPAADSAVTGGTIYLQGFKLADGSVCVKTTLSWKGSDALPVIAVYSTPLTEWQTEAHRVAAMWLDGAPTMAEVGHVREMPRLSVAS